MDFLRKALNIVIGMALLTYIGVNVIRLTIFFLEKN